MRIECRCGKRLRVDDALAGKTVRCPACGSLLQAEPRPVEIEAEKEAPRPAARRRDPDDEDEPRSRQSRPAYSDDEEDDRPRPRKKRKQPAKAGSSALLWLLVGGAGLAVAAVLVVTMWPRGGANTIQGKVSPPLGSNLQGATNLGGANGTSAAQGERVELSEPKVTMIDSRRFRVSVQYRFTGGQPRAGVSYVVFATLKHGEDLGMAAEIGKQDGASLKSAGILESESSLFHPAPEGATVSYELTMHAGKAGARGGGVYKEISDTLKGSASRSAGEGPRVLLSDAKVTILSPTRLRASVKYKFIQGRPVARTTYACLVVVNTGNSKRQPVGTLCRQDGEGMATEGVLETEFPIPEPIPEGAEISYQFTMIAGGLGQPGKGSAKTLADPVRGSTR
jgi:hypothetical protein